MYMDMFRCVYTKSSVLMKALLNHVCMDTFTLSSLPPPSLQNCILLFKDVNS